MSHEDTGNVFIQSNIFSVLFSSGVWPGHHWSQAAQVYLLKTFGPSADKVALLAVSMASKSLTRKQPGQVGSRLDNSKHCSQAQGTLDERRLVDCLSSHRSHVCVCVWMGDNEVKALHNHLHGHVDACSSPPGSVPCSAAWEKKVGLRLFGRSQGTQGYHKNPTIYK